jgi:hypothetical protein
MIRMRELDPQLALEDAEEIAIEMYDFERTGVAAQMHETPAVRFERRGARPREA